MTFRIVAERGCGMSQARVEKSRITVAPMDLNGGGKASPDWTDLGRQEIDASQAEFAPSPTTAAPGPAVFGLAFKPWH